MNTTFENVVKATGKNFRIEKSISGYYRLLCDDEVIVDDSAAEEYNKDLETAESAFANYLLEYEVPNNKKYMCCGGWILK